MVTKSSVCARRRRGLDEGVGERGRSGRGSEGALLLEQERCVDVRVGLSVGGSVGRGQLAVGCWGGVRTVYYSQNRRNIIMFIN